MDFDNDGLEDVISGSYHPGDLYLFKKQQDGEYAKGEKILDANEKPVNVGAASAAYLVDWDADEDLDLIVGNIQGQVFLVPNEGTRTEPKFGEKQPLLAGGKPVSAGHDAGPVAADWDGDGKLDLVVGGGDGSVQLFRNISDDESSPKLAGAKVLVPPAQGAAPGAQKPEDGLKHGMRTKVHVTDWNKDGKLDLMLGDISWEQAMPEQPGEQQQKQADARAQLQELQSQQKDLAKIPPAETPEQRKDRLAKLRDVQRQMIETSREALAVRPRQIQHHGYVWLFLRKDANGQTAGARVGGGS